MGTGDGVVIIGSNAAIEPAAEKGTSGVVSARALQGLKPHSLILNNLWHDSSHPSDEDLSLGTPGSRAPSHIYCQAGVFPQPVKPNSFWPLVARLKPCPFTNRVQSRALLQIASKAVLFYKSRPKPCSSNQAMGLPLPPPGPEVAHVDGVGVVVDVLGGQAHAQAGPLFGDYDAVLWIAGLVAGGAGEAGADLRGVNTVFHAGDVLRALIVDAADVVAVGEHGESADRFLLGAGDGFDLKDVEQHAVDQAARLGEEVTPALLQLLGSGALAEDEQSRKDGERSEYEQAGD